MIRIKDFIPEILDKYYIDEEGNLYTNYGKKKMSDNGLVTHGYIGNTLYFDDKTHKTFTRHRLVLKAFCPIPEDEKLQVNHKNGIKTDNRLENLEWVTCKENIRHAWKNNLATSNLGEKCPTHKITEEEAWQILVLSNESNLTQIEIGNKFGISNSTVSAIKLGKRWSHLYQKYISQKSSTTIPKGSTLK